MSPEAIGGARNPLIFRVAACGARTWVTKALILSFLACGAAAQVSVDLAAVGPGHDLTEANVVGKWYTLRDEALEFQAGGKLVYSRSNGVFREGGWSVSNNILWLTWSGEGGVPVLALQATEFNEAAIRFESFGGKSKSLFLRQKPPESELQLPLRNSMKSSAAGKSSESVRDADTPHMEYHDGPVVGHPNVHVLYWHSNWDSIHSSPDFKRGAIDSWFSSYMSSNYFNKANQYGVFSGNREGSDDNIGLFPDPGGSTNSVGIHAWLTGMIELPGTGVPYPCGNDVYNVMLPKGTAIDNGFNRTCTSFGAYHLFGPILVPPSVCGFLDPLLPTVRFVPYTVIPADCATKSAGPNGFYKDFDELTMLISHEMIEAATDPIDSFATSVPIIGGILGGFLDILDLSPAWYDNDVANLFTDSEAADICDRRGQKEVWLNNSLVAAYWSNADNDCAAGPGVVRKFSLKASGVPTTIPVPVNFDNRVPNVNAGGGFTINVATNTNHAYSYPALVNGTPGTRYVTTQAPGNVLVAGDVTVTAPYTTQHFLTVATNPGAAATGNVTLTASGWYAAGPFTIHTDPTVSAGAGSRYNFKSWSGDISANTPDFAFTLDGPKNATANYALQRQVTFTEAGIPAGPVWHVKVDGTVHVGPYAPWVDTGDTLNYTYDKVVAGTVAGTCYVLGGVSPPSPLLVSAPTTVTGTYTTQTVPQAIVQYYLVSTAPAAGGMSYVTYRADVVNCGRALGSVTARAETRDPFTVRLVPGQDVLNFAPVPANSQVGSSNTFTVLMNAAMPLDGSKLVWTFGTTPAAPVANAGPDQTVPVGSMVTIDGSASTNPSGMGTLTYHWVLVQRPVGSTARLLFDSTPSTQIVVSAPGVYVIRLTVSNGVQSSSTDVTITAI